MKKTYLRIVCALLPAAMLVALISGCVGKEELPDTYVEGSDYQYLLRVNDDKCKKVQQGNEIVYLLHRGFVYYLDETAKVILPLCSRADCLHDRETDEAQLEMCNAYIANGDVSNDGQIAYCNGYLYCVSDNSTVSSAIPLYRLSSDGSKKEIIYRFTEPPVEWFVHRNVLYYRTYGYITGPDGAPVHQEWLKALSLTDSLPEPWTFYEPSDGLAISVSNLYGAYGNYVHFYIIGHYDLSEPQSEADGEYRYYSELLSYDIRTGEVKEFEFAELPQYASMQMTSYWQDKPLFAIYYGDKNFDAPTTWYVCELDGSNPVPLMEDVPQGHYLRGGGEYLYYTNTVAWRMEEYTFYKILDENLNEVDSFLPPEYLNVDLRIGFGDRMYYIFDLVKGEDGNKSYDFFNYLHPETSLGWGVLVWDKSQLGSYNGAMLEFSTIMR